MKTAISMPDDVYKQANAQAKRLGISRSELITRALRRFLEEEQGAEIRASYDAAFGPESGDDDNAELRRGAARAALTKVEW